MKLIWAVPVALLAVLLAHQFLPWDFTESPEARFYQTSLTWLQSTPSSSLIRFQQVAVGYNTNADLVADAVLVLERLGLHQPPSKTLRKAHDRVRLLSDFSSLVAYYMTQGSAAERVIVDKEVCTAIVDAARAIGGVEHIGGNAALIAMRMAEHTNVLLAGNLAQELKQNLHPRISLLEGATAADPAEAHLILEYKKAQTWGDIVAPRANRVIVHCDQTNANFLVVPSFHSAINNASDLVVLSGLHLLDQESATVQRKRVELVMEQIAPPRLPASTPAHLELASMGNLNLMTMIGLEVAPHFNSLGLNEQELGFMYFALTHAKTSAGQDLSEEATAYVKEHFTDPKLDVVLDALHMIFLQPGTPVRQLDRVHFHSLKYHVVATRENGKWGDGRLSVLQGSLAATMNACGFSSLEDFEVPLTELLPIAGSGSTEGTSTATTSRGIQFAFSSVLVCTKPIRTVGLGDSISAAGLLHHEFKSV